LSARESGEISGTVQGAVAIWRLRSDRSLYRTAAVPYTHLQTAIIPSHFSH